MILTVTMNPAIDKCYFVNGFAQGKVNRVPEMRVSAGGKGLNVARVACTLGENATATGLVGGHSGKLLLSLLKRPVKKAFVTVHGETRSCVNVQDHLSAQSTELLEPGEGVTAQELELFEKRFIELLPLCSIVTISGSLPPDCPLQFYCKLIELCKKAGKQVLLDTSGTPLQAAAASKPTLIKPNTDEIVTLTKMPVNNSTQAAHAALKLHNTGIEYVVISLGSNGAVMACSQGLFFANAAKVTPVNTVGCGDSMLAGLAVGLLHKENAADTLRMGMAAGAANALTALTGCVLRKDYNALLKQIQVQQLPILK